MKDIRNPSLLRRYLSSPTYVHYFRDSLWPDTHIVEYAAGEYPLCQSDPPDHLYLMLTGRCCVRSLLPNGRSAILQTLRAPCLVGEFELFQDAAPRLVQALERTRMLAIPLAQSREELLNDPRFLRQVCADLIVKERSGTLSLLHTFGYPLENRLAKFILDNRQGDRFYIRKVHIAESLGASYRHVGAVLSSFLQRGYLTKEKLVYTIADESALSALSQDLEPFNSP